MQHKLTRVLLSVSQIIKIKVFENCKWTLAKKIKAIKHFFGREFKHYFL